MLFHRRDLAVALVGRSGGIIITADRNCLTHVVPRPRHKASLLGGRSNVLLSTHQRDAEIHIKNNQKF